MRKAIYPGTFDPITKGHLDVLGRACHLFDEVVLAIANNSQKTPFFTKEERLELAKENVKDFKNVEVIGFEGLTVDLARRIGAIALIRGMRAVSDFEFEFQMAQMNRQMDESVETIYLMPSHDYFFTSSTLIKSVARFSPERVEKLVPENVLNAFKAKLAR
ncbi:MAG: pantetheine-phosphate adenylyltransferase [Verrucomicrobia bacterium CG_4_10_14_3_um_filter_43_23]|nr:MAG: pantetheine-phosphate adenylyltransferase [Verrucomicrobia bacterium CG1_02_43_26]PIP58852.1 MAG: pantetheine-phosphate adenylyltransferase [Verrucomicrobia bacterium CG22_combo_CG10-13_8_21_14_all_43_17]PIX57776.1 MAG: pantetheine-phosphate adenylyltransferase [Verrucomicrobia bacterium CG_4_10_14_3_um_filter_43_23]PIY61058.1 MAG: pantetheine-phosphate adenylyltransferase [Verrucomicrobia bacterium CG_4_10_14_0_8_um_filter_43_34]PJA44244.1 MAG: pantetheine-phosphate adenylyltransferase